MVTLATAHDSEALVRSELAYLTKQGFISAYTETEQPFGLEWVVDTGAVMMRPMTTAEATAFVHGCWVGLRRGFARRTDDAGDPALYTDAPRLVRP